MEAEESDLGNEPNDNNFLNRISVLKLRKLTDGDLSSLLFNDLLTASTSTGSQSGEYKVSVSTTNAGLRVRAVSEGVLADLPCGTRIDSELDFELNTCRETFSDFLWTTTTRLLERRIVVDRSENGCELLWRRETRTRTGEEISEPLDAACDVEWNERASGRVRLLPGLKVIGEGANLLLLRILVVRPDLLDGGAGGGHRQWRAVGVDRGGRTRDCIYTLLGSRDALDFGAEHSKTLTGIERKFLPTAEGREAIWETWFDAAGRLQVRFQLNSPLTMRAPSLLVSDVISEGVRKLSLMDGGDRLADRRPSVTRSGCLCGIIPGRSHSVRSRRQ